MMNRCIVTANNRCLKCFFLILLTVVFSITQSKAQVEPLLSEKFAIHPKVGFGFTSNTANFNNFHGIIDCGLFQKGSGSGVTGFIVGEYPLSPSSFIGLGVGFIDRSSTLKVPGSFASYDASSKTITTITTENTIHATIGYIELQPEFRFSIIPNLLSGPLRAVGAFRLSFPVSSSFIQNESIISPENAAFISSGRREQTRQIGAGQINTMTPLGIGLSAGIENLLKVGANTFFTQQAILDYNVTNVTSDADWKQIAVRIELGLRFSILPAKEAPQIIVPPPPPPPAPPAKPIVYIDLIDVKAELHTGNEIIASSALVNTVFFAQKSAEIQPKYRIKNIETKEMPSDPIKSHEYILPQIAAILSNNPKATVVLEGSTSGTDDEPEGLELAESRSESVRNILINLGVASERISLRHSILPRIPSNQDFPEGRIENRRVDIILQNAPLQEYVSKRQVTVVTGTATAKISSKNIPSGEALSVTSNCMDHPIIADVENEMQIPMKCTIDNEQKEFTFTAEVSTPSAKATAEKSVSVIKLPIKQIDLKVDNFEAILRFDYNSSELSLPNKELLRQMIEPLPPGTSITIYGSTDALGTGLRNQQLSDERAAVTETFIRSLSGNKFNIKTATQTNKFNETTPEGRFLNRSMRLRLVK